MLKYCERKSSSNNFRWYQIFTYIPSCFTSTRVYCSQVTTTRTINSKILGRHLKFIFLAIYPKFYCSLVFSSACFQTKKPTELQNLISPPRFFTPLAENSDATFNSLMLFGMTVMKR